MFNERRVTRYAIVSSILGLAAAAAVVPAAWGNINLEWRPAEQTVTEGDIVNVGLYAVSDDDTDQSISAMDVILDWDPIHLELLGVDNNGPYEWLSSGFPDDSAFDGLNDRWDDGDALYQALAQLGGPAYATPDGLLVMTVQFQARAATSASGTVLTIPEERGVFTKTQIFDGEIPGRDVTGTLGSAAVRILCANGCVGDLDGDCDVDQADLGILLAHYLIDGGGDLDGDGDTDQSDLGILLADWNCGVIP